MDPLPFVSLRMAEAAKVFQKNLPNTVGEKWGNKGPQCAEI